MNLPSGRANEAAEVLPATETEKIVTTDKNASPHKITAEEAKQKLDSGKPLFLLDVRTQEEFAAQHIPGAVCIPDTELSARKGELPGSLDTQILVYCRSGRRSAASALVLTDLGYTSVYDFGGIIDWPYETTSDEAESERTEAAAPEETHVHQWEDHDCNYQQCRICGAQKRYSDPD